MNNIFNLQGLPEVKVPASDPFMADVDTGIRGELEGLYTSLRFVTHLRGIKKGRYYLIGAHPNIGKTTFTDFVFVLSTWLEAKLTNKSLRIFYVSLELSKKMKITKWCSFYIFIKYGVMLSSDLILGYIKDRKLTVEERALVAEASAFISTMLLDISITDKAITPDALVNSMLSNYYANYGTVVRNTPSKSGTLGEFTEFIPKANSKIPLTLLVVDHMALFMGTDSKTTMDRASTLIVRLRNACELSTVAVQQFNQDLNKSARESAVRHGSKEIYSAIAPKQMDFGDSTYTFRDADHVLGIVKPSKFDLKDFDGFPTAIPELGGLGDCLVVLYDIKNRYGRTDVYWPLFMNGVCGTFEDLPLDMDPDLTSWIHKALQIKQYG